MGCREILNNGPITIGRRMMNNRQQVIRRRQIDMSRMWLVKRRNRRHYINLASATRRGGVNRTRRGEVNFASAH